MFVKIFREFHSQVYQKKILDVVTVCGKKAAEHGVDKFVEISHAQIYDPKGVSAIGAHMCELTSLIKKKLN
jgi:hypothetical protein